MTGSALIVQERERQWSEEKFDDCHDDQHRNEELALAAVRYIIPEQFREDMPWPFAEKWWKPSPNDRVRELVKAGALIAAEIDRLQRIERESKSKGKPSRSFGKDFLNGLTGPSSLRDNEEKI